MFDRTLRPLKSDALGPAAERLAAVVPATAVTGVGLVVGLGAAAFAAAGWWTTALAAWAANRLLDGLDGEVARLRGASSDRGGYLDLVADAIVYGALPIGVAAGLGTRSAWIVAAVLLGTFYVNIVTLTLLSALLEKRSAGASAQGAPTSVILPAGLIEGAETIVFFALLLAVPSLAVWTMAIMAAGVAVTAVARTVAAWPQLEPGGARSDRRAGLEVTP